MWDIPSDGYSYGLRIDAQSAATGPPESSTARPATSTPTQLAIDDCDQYSLGAIRELEPAKG